MQCEMKQKVAWDSSPSLNRDGSLKFPWYKDVFQFNLNCHEKYGRKGLDTNKTKCGGQRGAGEKEKTAEREAESKAGNNA